MNARSYLSNYGQPMAGRGGAAHCQAVGARSPAFRRLRDCEAPVYPATSSAPSRGPGMGAGAGTMSVLGSPVRAYDFLLKFLLVGDSDVGKGEILASLQDGATESPYGHPAGERGAGRERGQERARRREPGGRRQEGRWGSGAGDGGGVGPGREGAHRGSGRSGAGCGECGARGRPVSAWIGPHFAGGSGSTPVPHVGDPGGSRGVRGGRKCASSVLWSGGSEWLGRPRGRCPDRG